MEGCLACCPLLERTSTAEWARNGCQHGQA